TAVSPCIGKKNRHWLDFGLALHVRKVLTFVVFQLPRMHALGCAQSNCSTVVSCWIHKLWIWRPTINTYYLMSRMKSQKGRVDAPRSARTSWVAHPFAVCL